MLGLSGIGFWVGGLVDACVELGFGMPHEKWHSQVSRGILAQYIAESYPHMKVKTQHRRFPVSDFNYFIIIIIIISRVYSDTTAPLLPSYQPRMQPILPTNMSSPATQFVYVPNLVGGQMLRIPIEDVEAEGQISISQQPIASPTLSSRYVRESSPSPSVESVDDTDE